MYEYIKGIITETENNYICLENNEIGYLIYTANPYEFKINEEYRKQLEEIKEKDGLEVLYKKALEKALNKKVDKIIIYSTCLQKEINMI